MPITIGAPAVARKVDRSLYRELLARAQEKFYSWADHQPHWLKRNLPYDPRNNVISVLNHGTERAAWVFGRNIVTDDGDIYYAKKGAGESPASNENFLQARCELRTTADTPAKADAYTNVAGPITASRKTITATYPKTNDTGDADNTGDTVDSVTYCYNWTTGDFSDADIEGGCLHDNASPSGATKLLTHFSQSQYAKTSTDTLKLFVNHLMNGV